MIRKTTIPKWPEDVTLEKDKIMDHSLQTEHKINETSKIILNQVDGVSSIEKITRQVCHLYNWECTMIEKDVYLLMQKLNSNYLINLKVSRTFSQMLHDWIFHILMLSKTFTLTNWIEKERISLSGTFSAFYRIMWFVMKSYSWLIIFLSAFVILWLKFLDIGHWITGFFIIGIPLLGFSLHEFGHYIAFLRLTEQKQKVFLARKFGAMQIVRPSMPLRQDLIITLFGPLLPFSIAVLCFFLLWIDWISEKWSITLWGIIIAFGVNIFSLIPPFADGKRVLWVIFQKKLERSSKNA